SCRPRPARAARGSRRRARPHVARACDRRRGARPCPSAAARRAAPRARRRSARACLPPDRRPTSRGTCRRDTRARTRGNGFDGGPCSANTGSRSSSRSRPRRSPTRRRKRARGRPARARRAGPRGRARDGAPARRASRAACARAAPRRRGECADGCSRGRPSTTTTCRRRATVRPRGRCASLRCARRPAASARSSSAYTAATTSVRPAMLPVPSPCQGMVQVFPTDGAARCRAPLRCGPGRYTARTIDGNESKRRMKKITCFKAYDVRGRVPSELDEDVAYHVGRAYAEFVGARRVAVGRDIRLSSPALAAALTRGLTDSGVDVLDIGVVGTEIVYFATFHEKLDGGIMVTASHNPPDYNGMKMVREESRPISADTGLKDIQAIAERESFREPERKGTVETVDVRPAYIEHLLSYVDREALKPLKIVVNAGNGGAGPIVDLLE